MEDHVEYSRRSRAAFADRLGAHSLVRPFISGAEGEYKMRTDIEIAQAAKMLPISQVAAGRASGRNCWSTTAGTRPSWT